MYPCFVSSVSWCNSKEKKTHVIEYLVDLFEE